MTASEPRYIMQSYPEGRKNFSAKLQHLTRDVDSTADFTHFF